MVSDQSGAMLAQAEVTLVDAEKGFTFSAKSDDKGRYLFRAVPPGTYNLSVKATGFKDQARSGIKVDVSQNVGVDFAMQILGTMETMTVSTAAPLLGTEDAVTGQVVDRKFINDLPLNGRGVFGSGVSRSRSHRGRCGLHGLLRQQLHLQWKPECHG